MDTGMLHTHILVVSLYLLQLLIRTGLLIAGKDAQLESISRKVRIPSIVISVLILATGIFLMVRSPLGTSAYVWVKLSLVLASIPLGIIGFRKKQALMAGGSFAVLALVLYLGLAKPGTAKSEAYYEASDSVGGDKEITAGRTLYYKHLCNSCHGDDGAAGYQGSKNLQETELTDAEIKTLLKNGKGVMPAYEERLTDAEMDLLIKYVRNFKTKEYPITPPK